MRHELLAGGGRTIVALAALFVLAACATPNIKPFAEQTSRLASTVASENKQIAAGWNVLAETLDDDEKQTYAKQLASFRKTADAIDALLQQAVAYSDRLVELADAGENGAAAADSLLASVRKFGSLSGVPGLVVSEAAASTFEKIASAASRVEAQQSLADATHAAQPAVEALADGIAELEAKLPSLIRAVGREQSRVVSAAAGPNLIGLYEAVKAKREGIYSGIYQKVLRFDPAKGFCVDDDNKVDPACKASSEFKAVEALNNIVGPLEPAYVEHGKRQASIRAWTSGRVAKASDIAAAARTWADEHRKIADVLHKCGGFRSLNCQEFGARKLRLALDQLKAGLGQGD